jgi:hypothetical protein
MMTRIATRLSSDAGGAVRFAVTLCVAVAVVALVGFFTNHMPPEWDMKYYVDMARHGVIGNPGLVAPFAYRPGAPLLVGLVARVAGLDVETTFRACSYLTSVLFIVCAFYFAVSQGATARSARVTAVALALYLYIVKWNAFAGTMVDIYAYPFLLLAFWGLLRERFFLTVGVSAVGLFFKEFLLLPLLVQAALMVFAGGQRRWPNRLPRLGVIALVLVVCFALPRLSLHVVATWQDVDPVNNRASLWRLISYPASWRRDLNIGFAYVACWLPVLLLFNARRLRIVRDRLRPQRLLLGFYVAFHFALVMYGGTNIVIFVTYLLPVEILVLTTMLDEGGVRPWEVALMLAIVFVFNRQWMPLPLPENGLDAYLDFYGGYHMRLTARSLARMGELAADIVGFWLVRRWLIGASVRPGSPFSTARAVV